MNRCFAILAVGMLAATAAYAAPTVDGTADAEYGAALSTQDTITQFGNTTLGDLLATNNGGSELDQLFGRIAGGKLYMTIAGNIENNFNKIEVFIDSKAGGVNSVVAAQLPAGVDKYSGDINNPLDGAFLRMNGLTFDADFSADYYLTFTYGREGVGPLVQPANVDHDAYFSGFSAHYADMSNGTSGAVVAAGIQVGAQGTPNVLRANGVSGTLAEYPYFPTSTSLPTTAVIGPVLPGLGQGQLIDKTYATSANGGCNPDNSGNGCVAKELEFVLPIDTVNDPTNIRNHRNFSNTIGLEMAINNSNAVGVSGGNAADTPNPLPVTDNPQSVTTGVEFAIPLAAIGNPSGAVKVTVFINGNGHNYASNQFGGKGLKAQNIGPLMPNLATEFTGNQYVPVPAAVLVNGDYNTDGTVNSADYTIWRDTFGSTTDLRANGDNTGLSAGKIDNADYTYWKTRFGNITGSGGLAPSGVPEPGTLVLMGLGLAASGMLRRRR